MKYFSLYLFLFLSSFVYSQTIHFRVVEIEKLKALSGVKVTSSLIPKDEFTTDSKGDIYINHLPTDTIVFSKPFYYPVSICIKQKDYDFKHMAEVIMIPSIKKTTVISKDLLSFEYHFVHDTLGENSHLNITTLEPRDAMITREVYKEKAFRFSHIDIKGKTEKSIDNYELTK